MLYPAGGSVHGGMRRITVRVPDELAEAIEEFAATNGVSITGLCAATMMQQIELFEEHDRTPVSEWSEHSTYDRWQRLIQQAREIDRERRSRLRSA